MYVAPVFVKLPNAFHRQIQSTNPRERPTERALRLLRVLHGGHGQGGD